MSDEITRKAAEIAQEFQSVRDLQDKEQFLKAVFIWMPRDRISRFLTLLSSQFSVHGITAISIRQQRTRDGTGHNDLLASFIDGMSGYWSEDARIAFRTVRKQLSHTVLPTSEMVRLLNECVDLTRNAIHSPLIVVLHLEHIPFTTEALRFIIALRDLTKATAFSWCVVSTSPTLMLFLGEVSYPRVHNVYDYRETQSLVTSATKILGLFPLRVYDASAGNWTSGSVVAFSPSSDADINLQSTVASANFVAFQGDNDQSVILSFSKNLGFRWLGSQTVQPQPTKEGIYLLTLQWPDLGLEINRTYSNNKTVHIATLTAHKREQKDTSSSQLAVFPSLGFVRLEVKGDQGYHREFIFEIA